MKHIKKMKIDIDKKNFEIIPSVQYDSNTRFLHINLTNGSIPFDLTGCSVKISGTKQDGTAIFNNCTIINAKKGFVEVELTEQINAIPGTVKCELKIYSESGVLTTKHFDIEVTAPLTASKEIVSSNEFKALTDALKVVQGIDNKADKEKVEEKFGEVYEQLDEKAKQIEEISFKSINHYKLKNDKDYTEAFRRYFADLKKGLKITLIINVRICEISEQIIMPYGVNISIVGHGQGNIIRYVGKPSTDIFYCKFGENGEIEGVDLPSLQGEIKNLRFETSVNNVIMFKQLKGYINNFAFKDCIFSNFKYAIWFEKGWWTNIVGCDFINGENGVMLLDANTSRIVNSYFRFMKGTGITYDSDLNYHKKGTAGILLDKVNFEQVECGIRFKSSIYGGHISGCYWECNANKPAIVMEDTSTMSCVTFTGNFARKDNETILNNIRNISFIGGHMALKLPETTTPTVSGRAKSVIGLMIVNSDQDFYSIKNEPIHTGEIYDLSFLPTRNYWQPLTSSNAFTVNREMIELQPNEEVTVAYALALRNFKLINYYADGIWKATVKVYQGATELYSKKSDVGEGSALKPLFNIEKIGSSPTNFTIRVKNETDSVIRLRGFVLNYSFNCYKS